MVHLVVEQCNRDGRMWNNGTSNGGTVEYLMVEQWNSGSSDGRTSDGGTVEQRWWNSFLLLLFIVSRYLRCNAHLIIFEP